MNQTTSDAITGRLAYAAHALPDGLHDYDPLMDRIRDARIVLLGEATHGTREFYRIRAEITQRLITDKGFAAVAVEADWPDAYRVNRYVQSRSRDAGAREALEDFQRFPTWMWRNEEVLSFVDWLKEFNTSRAAGRNAVGWYGLDLYSLHASIEAVLGYLDAVDPEAASRARLRYGCFDHFREDTQAYGYAAGVGLTQSCQDVVIAELLDLGRRAGDYLRRDGFMAEDAFFFAEQNARLVKNAEHYYRSMFDGRASSWNLRDRHMSETVEALMAHLSRHREEPRIVVWEHNSHVGDARATQMSDNGEITVGQLVRERYGHGAVLVGFTTYTGRVIAATQWGGPAERKTVLPARANSYEALFHDVGIPRFLLTWGDSDVTKALRERRLERAIGVIYRPETERLSHYFYARLPQQFDALVHIDETEAVTPLDRPVWTAAVDAPETYPSGI